MGRIYSYKIFYLIMFHGEFFNYQISTETYCRQRERSQQRYIKDPQNSWKYWFY